MDKKMYCAKTVAYFLLGVIVGGLLFYVTSLISTSEWVQTNIFRYKFYPSQLKTTSTQLNTSVNYTSGGFVSEPGLPGS